MTTIQIELPDALAQQAASAGLLQPERMQSLLRAQLRREAFAGLQALHAHLPAEEITAQAEADIAQAVREVRALRRSPKAT